MTVSGDILEFIDQQTATGIEGLVFNVYHFKVTAISPGLNLVLINEFLTTFWYEEFLTHVVGVQSADIQHTTCIVNNLMHYDTDFTILSPETPLGGAVGVAYNAPATAWSYQLVRQDRTTRNGSKRFIGVPETWVDHNIIQSIATEALADLQNALESGWTFDIGDEGQSMSMIPVIVRKPVVVTTPPTVINNVSGCLFRGIGSQNTRKRLLS